MKKLYTILLLIFLGAWTTSYANLLSVEDFDTMENTMKPESPVLDSIWVMGADDIDEIVTAGGSLQIIATVFPSDAPDPTVSWSITNESGFGLIDANGLLTAVADGTVVVSATANDGSGAVGMHTFTFTNQIALTSGLELKGILDLDIPGVAGKAIHVTATDDIDNLSFYGVGVANNGGGTDGEEYTFPVMSMLAGDELIVARDTTAMFVYFSDCMNEFDHILVANSDISQNGDDAIELFFLGNVIETFGDIDTDGTGESWEYLDSWAYKIDNAWTFGGVDCTDGAGNNLSSTCPYPLCPVPDQLVTSIEITGDGGASTINTAGGSLQMFATVLPADASDPSVSWALENLSGYAMITTDGLVTAYVDGEVLVTASSNDGSAITDSLIITISDQPVLLPALELKGVLDLGLSGSAGKAIHVVATDQIDNLSLYGIGVANNGGGTDGMEYSFPAMSLTAGQNLLVARDSAAMELYFESCYNSFDLVIVASSAISQNGDDAIELFHLGAVIETFGDIDVDGTDQPWEYLDSWAYNIDGNWIYGGVSCTSGAATNNEASCPYPFCPGIAVDSIYVSGMGGDTSIIVNMGTLQMVASIFPTDASNQTVSWSVTNETGFASINTDGILTALADGSVLVTATSNDGNGAFGSTYITIFNQEPQTGVLELKGIFDLDIAGVSGKAIHVTAMNDIADLSYYGIGVANNGGGTDGLEYSFPAMALQAGDEVIVARDTAAMFVYFGDCMDAFTHVLVANSDISQNGDDAIELFFLGSVNETFGEIDVDGTGQPWEYLDSWAFKVDGEWTFGGVDCTDGAGTNLASACPYPFCPLPENQVTSITVMGEGGATEINTDGGSLQMIATVLPIDASDPSVNWSVVNLTGYATISTDGLLNAFKNGVVTVSATANDGSGVTDSLDITISNQSVLNAGLSLQGILDLGLSGSTGKAIHVFATEDIADMSIYGIGVANNGGGTDGLEYVFPVMAMEKGTHMLVARDTIAMALYFEDCLGEFDYVLVASGDISQNGDDAIELFFVGEVIETFGDIDVDGTGESWEYKDSWAYKEDDVWLFGGVECTLGVLTNSESSCPYPLCPTTNVNKLNVFEKLVLFPNPADEYIKLVLKDEPTQIKILSITGHNCIVETDNFDKIDVSSLSQGTYIIQVSYSDRIQQTKFIKN